MDDDTKLIVVRGIIRDAVAIKDKAIAIENEIGMNLIYSLIAMGRPEDEISTALGLTKGDFSYILKQSSDHRTKYLKAKTYKLAEKSVETLIEEFDGVGALDDSQKRAIDFHSKNVDRQIQLADDAKNTSGVIINNVLTIRKDGDIPAIPQELEEVIVDADFDVEAPG